jgi:hypothetical protein
MILDAVTLPTYVAQAKLAPLNAANFTCAVLPKAIMHHAPNCGHHSASISRWTAITTS